MGLTLTVWRSYECLEKYFKANLGTRIKMKSSYETILPMIVLCPEYFAAYNENRMRRVGIADKKSYQNGKWFGNDSSKSPEDVFKDVTHDLGELIESFSVLYKSGIKKHFSGNFDNLSIIERGHRTYGRCYELEFANNHDNVFFVDVVAKRPIYVFINSPHTFYNEDSRSKIQVNINESLFMEINYEILISHHSDSCRMYSNIDIDTYDDCKIGQVEKMIWDKFQCSVPFTKSFNKPQCQETAGYEASQYFKDITGMQFDFSLQPP